MKKRNERKVIKKSDNCWLVAMTVIYNIKDPRQKRLLEQADTVPNFSGFVKHLQEANLLGWDSRSLSQPKGHPFSVVSGPVQQQQIDTQPVHELVEEPEFDSVDAFL